MAKLFETQIDDEVRSALESGGYYTEGFEGQTLGEYRDWYKGAIGIDPFSTASSLSGGAPVPTDVDSAAAWIGRNPLNYDPNIGYTGQTAGLSNRGLAELQRIEEQRAGFEEKQSYQRGLGMINWLMGLSTEMSGADFSKIAPIGMAGAQARMGYQAPVTDYSGILGVRHAEQMAAERAEAAKFDFTRDLLPSLITLGGTLGSASIRSGDYVTRSDIDRMLG